MNARTQRRGFTLLEVMLAVAIMAIALGAVFSAQVGSVKMAQRARMLGMATLLTRCKMGEIEEHLAKVGLPSIMQTESDNCCKDAPIDGFKCKWEISPVVLPDTMFGEEEGKDGKKKPGAGGKGMGTGTGAPGLGANGAPGSGSGSGSKGGLTGLLGAAAAALGGNKTEGSSSTGSGPGSSSTTLSKDGKTKDGKDGTPGAIGKDGKPIEKQDPKEALAGDPSRFLSGGNEVDGMTAMAMQLVYPVLKPSFQGQIRRVSVNITWEEGEAQRSMDLTQYIVAEQPVALTQDPNDPNGLLGGTGTGLGTGTLGMPGSTTPGSTGFGTTP
jgi:prepilin-type N-terminal cleavage/methylation domain-containing protein